MSEERETNARDEVSKLEQARRACDPDRKPGAMSERLATGEGAGGLRSEALKKLHTPRFSDIKPYPFI